MKDVADLIGRILLAFIFLFEAYDSIAFFKANKALMTEYGVTWNQDFLMYASILLLVIGGILILIGYRTSLGAICLLLYWIPLTFTLYSFWNDPEEIRRLNSLMFICLLYTSPSPRDRG